MMPVLFLSLCLLEGLAFYLVGSLVGGWWTVGLTFLTTLIGLVWVQRQGLAVLLAAHRKTALQEAPLTELYDGLCLALAGVLIVLPGFVTDLIGFSLLFTPFRRFCLEFGADIFIGAFSFGMMDTESLRQETARRQAEAAADADIIDADYEVVDEPPKELKNK